MTDRYENRIAGLQRLGGHSILTNGARGIEKESLRITPAGRIAATPHPAALGSALTNRFVTTDYSEALVEFVTPPEPSPWAAMQFLCDVHKFVYDALEDELLWPLSMPCRLGSEEDIQLAQYGTSNIGRMKTIYRRGLGHRYGRYMQVISGIHFNYSVPDVFWPALREVEQTSFDPTDFKSTSYMGLVRNVRRLDWLLLYLFGASPALCRSFVRDADTGLESLDGGALYGPFATSLRMSDLGYQNTNQAALRVSANSLDEYIRDLSAAIRTPNDEYARIGVRENGDYLQLNINQLQIENEYYSTIRPKRVARSGERPTSALQRGGVEYVELRALDISPFDPAGIGQAQQKFLEAFLIYCLLADSPAVDETEQNSIKHNHGVIAREGRRPGLELQQAGVAVSMSAWAESVLESMRPVCEMLDGSDDDSYTLVLEAQLAAVRDSELTPSARLLRELREAGGSFADYGLSLANDYSRYFAGLSADFNAHTELFAAEAAESVQRQRDIEAADTLSLDDYLESYYA